MTQRYIKHGKYCGDKIQYPDGVGCCIWIPIGDQDELKFGICFDFSEEDIDQLVELLQQLKVAEVMDYVEDTHDSESWDETAEQVLEDRKEAWDTLADL